MLIGMSGPYLRMSEGALLSPILASSAGMLPSAILCALFLLMPYGGWIPALICAFAGALFAPAHRPH